MELTNEQVNYYRKRFYPLAYRITRNAEDAEDVMQNTFLKLIQSSAIVNSNDAFVCKCVVTRAIEFIRNKRAKLNSPLQLTTVHEEEIEAPDCIKEVEDKEVVKSLYKKVRETLAHHNTFRTVLLMRMHGDTYEEIANATGTTVATVKTRLSRARGMMNESTSQV